MDISKWGCFGCGNLKGKYCTFFGQELEKDSYCPEYRHIFEKMGFNEYQELAQRTSSTEPEDKLLNGLMGMNGESGEAIDVMKKHLFQYHGLDKRKIIDEISDVLWYIAETCTGLNITLEELAIHNIKKLQKRYPDGFEADKSINRADRDE